HQAVQRFLGRVRDVRGRPADLLESLGAEPEFKLLELRDGDGVERPIIVEERRTALDPAVVCAGADDADLGEGNVAVLLQPQPAGDRVEVEAEAVPDAVGEDFVEVAGDRGVELSDLPADLPVAEAGGADVEVGLAVEDRLDRVVEGPDAVAIVALEIAP